MARLPRATFALMLTLLPATATIVGAVVLSQMPTLPEITGILLVAAGVYLHKPRRSGWVARPLGQAASMTCIVIQVAASAGFGAPSISTLTS